MGRRDSSGGGCLVTLFLAPCLGGFVIGIPAVVLAAPGLVPYLYLTDPAQFAPHRLQWFAALAAAPLLALILVWWASPQQGRIRGRRQPTGDPAAPGGPRRRPSIRAAILRRVVVLLGATSSTALVMLVRGNDGHGPAALRETWTLFGSTAVAAAVVLGAIRLWDRRPCVEPVTVETVREAADQADRALRRVRADNRRLDRLVHEVETKLATVRAVDFAILCNLHFESVGCADGAYAHYRSTQTSLTTMAQLLHRVYGASRRPAAVRRHTAAARRDRAELAAATAQLADTHGQLDVEVQRGLTLVQTLNANTAELKHRIRDNCGERGQRWFADLQDRIERARSTDQRTVRAAW